MENNLDRILNIALNFETGAAVVKGARYGNGHINDTYKVTAADGTDYILQRINDNVFTNVAELMENIVGVTEYIASASNVKDECLRVIPTKEGSAWFKAPEGYFRMYNFISAGISIETVPTAEELYLSAVGFGRFQKALDGYPVEKLYDSIPDFHNTMKRYERFEIAVAADKAGRAGEVRAEIDFVRSRSAYAGEVVGALKNGELPLRVTHNDTKLNNVLIDLKGKRPVTVIDLDTVMRGSILYDFGDGVRSGASTGAEDERDLTKVSFSKERYEAFAKGFAGEAGERLTKTEKSRLYFGAILMTYECGMRFLTDYLEGDVYFKVHRPGHNLDRALTQFKLVEDMEKERAVMRDAAEGYANGAR